MTGPAEANQKSGLAIDGLLPAATLIYEDKHVLNGRLETALVIRNNSKVPIQIDDFKFGMYFDRVEHESYDSSEKLSDVVMLVDADHIVGSNITASGEKRIAFSVKLGSETKRGLDEHDFIYLYSHITFVSMLTTYQRAAIPEELNYQMERTEWLRWNVPLPQQNRDLLRSAG